MFGNNRVQDMNKFSGKYDFPCAPSAFVGLRCDGCKRHNSLKFSRGHEALHAACSFPVFLNGMVHFFRENIHGMQLFGPSFDQMEKSVLAKVAKPCTENREGQIYFDACLSEPLIGADTQGAAKSSLEVSSGKTLDAFCGRTPCGKTVLYLQCDISASNPGRVPSFLRTRTRAEVRRIEKSKNLLERLGWGWLDSGLMLAPYWTS